MALESIPKSFRAAALGAGMIGALVGTGVTSAQAQTVPVDLQSSTHAQPFTVRECGLLLAVASEEFDAVATGKGALKYNPEFPESLANFIAPKNPKPVYDIIVSGSFDKFVHSQAPEDLQKKREVIASLSCDGSPYILTRGSAIAMFNAVRTVIGSGKQPIDLQARGLQSITPEKFQAMRPISPRSEIQAPPKHEVD